MTAVVAAAGGVCIKSFVCAHERAAAWTVRRQNEQQHSALAAEVVGVGGFVLAVGGLLASVLLGTCEQGGVLLVGASCCVFFAPPGFFLFCCRSPVAGSTSLDVYNSTQFCWLGDNLLARSECPHGYRQ